MSQIYDDRREEPRFPARGTARIGVSPSEQDGTVVDLSLNGVMIYLQAPSGLNRGDRIPLRLGLDGASEFEGEALVVYVSDERLGLEFFDMSTADFDVLARLIESLRRQPVA